MCDNTDIDSFDVIDTNLNFSQEYNNEREIEFAEVTIEYIPLSSSPVSTSMSISRQVQNEDENLATPPSSPLTSSGIGSWITISTSDKTPKTPGSILSTKIDINELVENLLPYVEKKSRQGISASVMQIYQGIEGGNIWNYYTIR